MSIHFEKSLINKDFKIKLEAPVFSCQQHIADLYSRSVLFLKALSDTVLVKHLPMYCSLLLYSISSDVIC